MSIEGREGEVMDGSGAVLEDYVPEFCGGCDRELEYDAQTCHNCDETFCDRCFGSTYDDLYAGWCKGCAG